MGAVDLVVQETLPVLPQVQVPQPVCHVVLGPVGQRLGGKRLRWGWGGQMGVAEAGGGRERVERWRRRSREEMGRRKGSRDD